MTEFFKEHDMQILYATIALLVSLIGWFLREYSSRQKKADAEQMKAINGLGDRLTKSLDDMKSDVNMFRLEVKADLKEVSSKIDRTVSTVHDIEKKVMVNSYEAKIRNLRKAQ